MAIIKIVAIVLFVICGLCIWLGLTASDVREWGGNEGFIGTSIMLAGEGSVLSKLFPEGGMVMITLMIWTLVNFQGSEIVGLSAAETQNPEVNVPLACKRVAYRIILIYLVPIFVLTLIMPYFEGNIEKSVFADALYHYGFTWGSQLFTVVTMIAAFSCANSGFYGTVRSLYGLSVEGLAPKFLSNLNRFNTPQNATLFTLVPIWLVFILGFGIDELGWWGGEMPLYTALVGIAGFTGTLCWVGILYSQTLFRKRLKERGYDPGEVLSVKAAWYPGLEYFAIVLQVAAMIMLIFEEGGLDIFILSMIIIIVPIVIFVIQKKRGKIRTNIVIGVDEITFDQKFPRKN
jgi:AAT family amino acid transporter